MIEWVRPRAFVPVHGSHHHLRRHAKLASDLGVADVHVIENGTTLRWNDGRLRDDGSVPHGRVHLDHGRVLSEATLADRDAMATSGVVVASASVDTFGVLRESPRISTRGVLLDDPPDVLAEEAADAIREQLRVTKGARTVLSPEEAREAIAKALRRVYRVGSRRPIVTVLLDGDAASTD